MRRPLTIIGLLATLPVRAVGPLWDFAHQAEPAWRLEALSAHVSDDTELSSMPVALALWWSASAKLRIDAVGGRPGPGRVYHVMECDLAPDGQPKVRPRPAQREPLCGTPSDLAFRHSLLAEEFAFNIRTPSLAAAGPQTPVERWTPEGICVQPLESLNHRYLARMPFARLVPVDEATSRLQMTDGLGAVLAEGPAPFAAIPAGAFADMAPQPTESGWWGAMAERIDPAGKAVWFKAPTVYELTRAGVATWWSVPKEGSTRPIVDERYGPVALSAHPEQGAWCWRQREYRSYSERLWVRQLLWWKRDSVRIKDTWAIYECEGKQTCWWPSAAAWAPRPVSPFERQTGYSPAACAAVSPDGKQLAYLRGLSLVVARIER